MSVRVLVLSAVLWSGFSYGCPRLTGVAMRNGGKG